MITNYKEEAFYSSEELSNMFQLNQEEVISVLAEKRFVSHDIAVVTRI